MADQNDAVALQTLDESDLDFLETVGTRRPMRVGEYLFREGDSTYDFYAIRSGAVDIVLRDGNAEKVLVQHGPGRFLGELSWLTGQRVLLSARVAEPGEVVVVPRAVLREIIATRPGLGDRILAAFLARRSRLLQTASATIRVVGSRYSPDTLRIREFLTRNLMPHEWLDPDVDPAVDEVLRSFAVEPAELPVVIVAGSVLRRPTPGLLAEFLGLTVGSLPERCVDLVVVGGGPAGLAAAVYGASEGLRTLVVEMIAVGGQAGTSSRIENYLGFPMGISGGELTQRAVVQAEKFGAFMSSPCTAVSLRDQSGHLVVRLSDGSDVAGRAVIAASGARYRRLGVPRLEEFEENGVYYAATELEARICATSPVVVVGGGNSAGQAAVFLSQSAASVMVVVRGPDLRRSMSRYLVDRIEAEPHISVRTETEVVGLDGEQGLRSVRLRGPRGEEEVPCQALFSFIGADPSADWLDGCVAVDGHGFVLTDRSLSGEHLGSRWELLGRDPLPFETSHPGLFAVGDVRAGSTKRVAAAVGEGSASVRSVHEFLAFAH